MHSYLLSCVQIIRPDFVDIGILLGRVDLDDDDDDDYTTQWIVSVEGKGQGKSDEEEISERYLGRILSHKEEVSSGSGSSTDSRRKKTRTATAKTTPSPPQGRSSKGRGQQQTEVVTKAAAAASKPKPKVAAAASSKPAAKTAHKKESNSSRKYGTRSQRRSDDELLIASDIEKIERAEKMKKSRTRVVAPYVGPDETVIEVKMLTGTLYLFRGPNPRAEFIRIV